VVAVTILVHRQSVDAWGTWLQIRTLTANLDKI